MIHGCWHIHQWTHTKSDLTADLLVLMCQPCTKYKLSRGTALESSHRGSENLLRCSCYTVRCLHLRDGHHRKMHTCGTVHLESTSELIVLLARHMPHSTEHTQAHFCQSSERFARSQQPMFAFCRYLWLKEKSVHTVIGSILVIASKKTNPVDRREQTVVDSSSHQR